MSDQLMTMRWLTDYWLRRNAETSPGPVAIPPVVTATLLDGSTITVQCRYAGVDADGQDQWWAHLGELAAPPPLIVADNLLGDSSLRITIGADE